MVDRPLALLVKLVPATEQILEKGVLFDPFIQGDIELEQEQEQEQAQGVLQEQEQEQEKVAQIPQQQETVVQQEDAAAQHGAQHDAQHGLGPDDREDAAQGSAAGQLDDAGAQHGLGLDDREDQDHGTDGDQLPDATEGAGELEAVNQRSTPTQHFANWQGGRAKGSVIKDNVVLPVMIEGRPQRSRKKLDKFV